jgi:hypothetical protein
VYEVDETFGTIGRSNRPGVDVRPHFQTVITSWREGLGKFVTPECRFVEGLMERESNERWKELCAQAAIEQDPAKLLALVEEINRLLEKREQSLNRQPMGFDL